MYTSFFCSCRGGGEGGGGRGEGGGGGGVRLMYGKEGPGSAYINQRDSFCVTAVNVFLRAI